MPDNITITSGPLVGHRPQARAAQGLLTETPVAKIHTVKWLCQIFQKHHLLECKHRTINCHK